MTDKEQQGLTDEEILAVWFYHDSYRPGIIAQRYAMDFARAIEAKVRQASTAPAGVTQLLDHIDAYPGTGDYHGLPKWIGRLDVLRKEVRAALAGEGTNANSLNLGSSAGKE
jgi:hypothetical protein